MPRRNASTRFRNLSISLGTLRLVLKGSENVAVRKVFLRDFERHIAISIARGKVSCTGFHRYYIFVRGQGSQQIQHNIIMQPENPSQSPHNNQQPEIAQEQQSRQEQPDPYSIDRQQLAAKISEHDWSDIDSLAQSQVSEFVYTVIPPEKYRRYYQRLRRLLGKEEISERSLSLSGIMLGIRTSNYYALMLRKECYNTLKTQGLLHEIHFINCLLSVNAKEYHLWTYKKQLIAQEKPELEPQELKKMLKSEMDFLNQLFKDDSKNYHAWDFRFWLVINLGLVDLELNWTADVLFGGRKIEENRLSEEQYINANCYSLWSHRFNLFKYVYGGDSQKMQELMESQSAKVIAFVRDNNDNQCGWNYLSGICYCLQKQRLPEISEKAQQIEKSSPQKKSLKALRFILTFHLTVKEILQEDTLPLIQELKAMDKTRQLYYEYLLDKRKTV